MRLSLVLTAVLFVAGSALADSVTINNPADGENVPAGTVWVDATASATSAPIWVIQIYLNGSKATEKVVNNVSSCAIDAGITVGASSNNQLTVQILQQNGTLITRTTIHFNAVTAITTIPAIDDSTTGWHPCNGCGGGGGGNPVPETVVASPSEDGSAMEFTTIGESGFTGGFGTSYWYHDDTTPTAKIAYLKYSFDIYVPAAYVNTPQAIEFECQQQFNGLLYNFGWQAEYKGTPNNRWRIFDYPGSAWLDSGLALTRFTGDTWHHIVSEFHIDNVTNDIYHDAITIDGTRMYPTQNFKLRPASNSVNKMTNAFQLDMDGSNTAYTTYVDNLTVSYTTY